MTRILSIDPGAATGFALGAFTLTQPYKLINAWTVAYGSVGDVLREEKRLFAEGDFLVVEEFTLSSGNQFVADLAPKKVEGMIELLWGVGAINYQPRSAKAHVGDSVLKEHGLWRTGKMVGWSDGRDANDAIIHALAFLKLRNHEPTIRKYWSDND